MRNLLFLFDGVIWHESQGSNNIQASRRIKTLERHRQINADTLNTSRDLRKSQPTPTEETQEEQHLTSFSFHSHH